MSEKVSKSNLKKSDWVLIYFMNEINKPIPIKSKKEAEFAVEREAFLKQGMELQYQFWKEREADITL